jgi:hypothetical protein
MSIQATHSKTEIYQSSLKVKDNIIKMLNSNGYDFNCHHNDLYLLKSKQIVRRLKGYIALTTNKHPEGEWNEKLNKQLKEYYTLDDNTFLKVKKLVQLFSNNEFDCDLNKLKLNKAGHWGGYWGEEFTYILKIVNKQTNI